MEGYRVQIRPSAVRELDRLPLALRRRVVERIRSLAGEPRPQGSEKLSGMDRYRLRQGSYRVLYSIDDRGRSVTVIKIGHRRDVYR